MIYFIRAHDGSIKLECGRGNPTIRVLSAISAALDTRVDDLMRTDGAYSAPASGQARQLRLVNED
jgi:transcriptional regulator with XRE-family HTH domain